MCFTKIIFSLKIVAMNEDKGQRSFFGKLFKKKQENDDWLDDLEEDHDENEKNEEQNTKYSIHDVEDDDEDEENINKDSDDDFNEDDHSEEDTDEENDINDYQDKKKSFLSFFDRFKKSNIQDQANSNENKSLLKNFSHVLYKKSSKHDVLKKKARKISKLHKKKGNRLFVVVHDKFCDFCVKSPQGKVVDREYCDNSKTLDVIAQKLNEFDFYEAIIIIDTNDIKFEYFTAPPLNLFTRDNFMKNKLKGSMANFPIKSYFFDCNNPNKTGNYILMGLNINDFVIDIIQFIDDRLDLYIPYFLFSNIELSNVLIDIRKKIDDKKEWDKLNKILAIRYDENAVRLILTRRNHFLFSRDVNYNITGKIDDDCKQLAHEINGLQNYAVRTFNLNNSDFIRYCVSISDEDDYLYKIMHAEKYLPEITFFSLEDLKIETAEKHFINNLFIQDELFQHTVKFQTQKINNANQFVLLQKICIFLVIISIVTFLGLSFFNIARQFQLNIKKSNLQDEFIENEGKYQNMMAKLGYDASEIINIRNMINIYRDTITKKQCSIVDEILHIGQFNFKSFMIKSLSWNADNRNNNEININIVLNNNIEEFFRILSDIDAIEKNIESNKDIRNLELDGLPEQYSLSAVYSDLDLKIKYLKKVCHEN